MSPAEAPLSHLPWLHRPSHCGSSVLEELPCSRCRRMGCSGPALAIHGKNLEGRFLSGWFSKCSTPECGDPIPTVGWAPPGSFTQADPQLPGFVVWTSLENKSSFWASPAPP